MNQTILLKLHRWTSLIFAAPLAVIVLTGFVLSFEPMVQGGGLPPGLADAERIAGIVQRLDPGGKARGVAISAVGERLRVMAPGAAPVDLRTGETATTSDPVGDVLMATRQIHEHLFGMSWLVIASTVAMVVIMAIGVLMGWPRLRNTLSGWHKGAAWFALPLLLVSPLTALCMVVGLTFGGGATPAPRGALGLADAVRVVARSHDVAHLASIRIRSDLAMARIYEGGELRAYMVTSDGSVPMGRNWPRLLHEGNWSTWVSGPLNIAVSVVFSGLLVTGVWLWARRRFRRRPIRST